MFDDLCTYTGRGSNSRPLLQVIRVLLPLRANSCAVVVPVLREDIVADDPRSNGNVDKTELLAQEIRALDLLPECLLRLAQVFEGLLLLFRSLCLQQALPAGYDGLRDEVDPDAGVGAVDRVGGQYVRLVRWVGVFEELAKDQRLVQGASLVLNSRNETLRVDIYDGNL